MNAILRARPGDFHRRTSVAAMALLLAAAARAGETRVVTPLGGVWRMLLDPGDQGLRDGWLAPLSAGELPERMPAPPFEVPVPGPLEVHQPIAHYDGLVWYARRFEAPLGARDDAGRPVRSVLRFDEVNAACRAWLDGVEVGAHEGWGPFEFDLGAALREAGEHVLVLRVLDAGDVETDGMTVRSIPHAKETWYHNTGGLLGDVTLVQHVEAEARVLRLIADPSSGEARVDLLLDAPPGGPREADVALELLELPLGARVDEAVPLGVRAVGRIALSDGRAGSSLSAFVPQPRAWSVEQPWRYVARVTCGGRVEDVAFGFRPLRLDADGLSLGLPPRPLKGVLYQPWYAGLGGRTPPPARLEAEVAAIKEAGFDLVRAHVRPAPPAFLDAADRLGLMVFEEPPIGWVDDDPLLLPRMADAVRRMIERDQRHPSIVMWGMLNELSGKAYRYADELVQHAADADASRPILEDSGAFFGDGRYLPPGEREAREMHDEHVYPAYPLSLDERERMRGLGRDDGPTFVSEYGYGTLLDTDSLGADFARVPAFDPERRLLDAFCETAGRVRASGADWSRGRGWVAEAQALQADAAADMTDALRANPRLDMLCWTQWQAVSHESSAGLLSPGGRPRPALAALRDALRPLHVAVFPDRASARPGEVVDVDVVVVNDTGAAVEAALDLRVEGGTRVGNVRDPARPERVAAGVLAAGVSVFPVQVAAGDGGLLALGAAVASPARGELVESRDLALPVCDARATDAQRAGLALALLEDDPAARSFARRVGLPFVEDARDPSFADPSTVVLVSRPEALIASLAFSDRIALWSKVRAGGAVVVLVDGPRGGVAGLFGGARGVQTLDGLPVPVHVASAAGNFMGRVYPLLDAARSDGTPRTDRWLFDAGGGARGPQPEAAAPGRPPTGGHAVRLLDRFDATLVPRAMLVEPLPDGARPGLLVLGHAGDRIGVAACVVPWGAGRIALVGVPLLEPVLGDHDARRDRVLLELLLDEAARARAAVTPEDARAALAFPALEPLDEALLERRTVELGRLVDVAERESIVAGARLERYELPPVARAALEAQQAALAAFVERRDADGRALLDVGLAALDERAAGFLELERAVLRGLAFLVDRRTRADLDLAYATLEDWVRGLAFWSAGDLDTALDWLGRAELALRASRRLPADLVRTEHAP